MVDFFNPLLHPTLRSAMKPFSRPPKQKRLGIFGPTVRGLGTCEGRS